MRTTVVRFEVTRTCFQVSEGNRPRVTRRVKTWSELVAPEHALRIVKKLRVAATPPLRKSLHARRQLRRARSVAHHACKLAWTGFACAAAGIAAKDETMAVRTRAPGFGAVPVSRYLYLPVHSIRDALVSAGAFTVNSAERETVCFRERVRGVHFKTVLPRRGASREEGDAQW